MSETPGYAKFLAHASGREKTLLPINLTLSDLTPIKLVELFFWPHTEPVISAKVDSFSRIDVMSRATSFVTDAVTQLYSNPDGNDP